jgi:hypothetical protein
VNAERLHAIVNALRGEMEEVETGALLPQLRDHL